MTSQQKLHEIHILRDKLLQGPPSPRSHNTSYPPSPFGSLAPASVNHNQTIWVGATAIPKWVIKYEYLRLDMRDPSGGNPDFIDSYENPVAPAGIEKARRRQRLLDDLKALADSDTDHMFLLELSPPSSYEYGTIRRCFSCVHDYYILAYGYPTKTDAEKDIPRLTLLADKLDRASLDTGTMEVFDLEKLCPSRHLYETKDLGSTRCKENDL
jgi:hypothetical protein